MVLHFYISFGWKQQERIENDRNNATAYTNSRLNEVGKEINQLLPAIENQGGNGDKGDHHHDYLDYYEHLLRSFRDRSFSLLEIGINMGYSLVTWVRRYPQVRVTGIDIDLSRWVRHKDQFRLSPSEEERLRVIEGDATSSSILPYLTGSYDVILDDGSHTPQDMIAAFESLFPTKLKNGGIYIVEDVHCDGDMIRFIRYAQDLFPFVYKSPSWDGCRMLSGSETIRNESKEDWRYMIREIIIHRDIVVFTKESPIR